MWNTVVEEILGTKMVESVRVRNAGDGTTKQIACSGFFAYPGLAPNSEFLPPEVKRNAEGQVMTIESLQTSLSGVFAAGAVRAGCGGLLADAMADARTAATGACAHLGK
jgi:thioredoxin reductase (NADPH)